MTLEELEAHARAGQAGALALAAASPEADRSFIIAVAKRFEVAAENAKLQREFLELRVAKAGGRAALPRGVPSQPDAAQQRGPTA